MSDLEQLFAVQPGDRALTFQTNQPIPPPDPHASWEAAGFEQCVFAPRNFQRSLFKDLKALPVNETLYAQLVADIDSAIERVTQGLGGRLHVYFEGPHALALRLGHSLREKARHLPVLIHQFGGGGWAPFVAVNVTPAIPKGAAYFGPAMQTTVPGNGRGVALTFEAGRSEISEAHIEQIASATRAGWVRSLAPLRRGSFIDAGPQAVAAVTRACTELQEIRKNHPGSPVHLATSGNVGFLIALGHHLPVGVYSELFVHQFDPPLRGSGLPGRYVQVLEVFTGEVVTRNLPHHLRIVAGDGGVFYDLDGEILRACLPLPFRPPAIHLEAPTRDALYARAAAGWRGLIPETVRRRMLAVADLDIEISPEMNHGVRARPRDHADEPGLFERLKGLMGVGGDAAGEGDEAVPVDWEHLALPGLLGEGPARTSAAENELIGFAAVSPGWCLYRVPIECGQDGPTQGPGGPPRLLIVNALRSSDPARGQLSIDRLEALLTGAGSAVRLIDVLESGPAPTHTAGIEALEREVRAFRPDVVHWFGHGAADGRDLYAAVLQVSHSDGSDGIDKARLLEAFKAHPPRLMVLTACSVGAMGRGYGASTVLIGGGVGAMVAFQTPVYPKQANLFNGTLYPRLLTGASIGAATQEARRALFTGSPRSPAIFASPALYARNRAHLGPLTAEASLRFGTHMGGDGATAVGESPLPLEDETKPGEFIPPGAVGWLDALFRLLGGDVDARSFLKGDSADGRDDDEEGPLPLDEPIKHGGGTVPPGKAGVPGASSATGKKKGAEASSEDNKKRHEREA